MATWVAGNKVTRSHLVSLEYLSQEAYLSVRPILAASYSTAQYTGGLGTAMIPKVGVGQLLGHTCYVGPLKHALWTSGMCYAIK